MNIALTGATGNMGREVLACVLRLNMFDKIKVLVLPEDKRIKDIKKLKSDKIEILKGNLADIEICKRLVSDVEYVVNMAAVIPPLSDKYPQKAIECNQVGVDCLVTAIEQKDVQPKLIHISTMALYGNRNYKHIWARVGDPLLVSPFDIYSATKLRGEFRVLESDIEKFVVLRQNAMIHPNMLMDNISDGLMFHTCFNSPLEWVTSRDSGELIANILKRDVEKNDLDAIFWRKCFNIGGGEKNRITGYDTLDDGFKIIGGSTKDFFMPNYNATRNFHGAWFTDGNKLDELFHYQTQSVEAFWKQIKDSHFYFKLASLVPKAMIKSAVIKRLFKSPNSPAYWIKHNDEAKIIAYFGSRENYDKLSDWQSFPLLIENKSDEGEIDYKALRARENAKSVDLYFDPESEITLTQLNSVASAHGGKLLSSSFKDPYEKLSWCDSDGNQFTARAYTVLNAGHWHNRTYSENVWEFDRLAKTDKIYSQVWYDSHGKDEDYIYYFDNNFKAHIRKI